MLAKFIEFEQPVMFTDAGIDPHGPPKQHCRDSLKKWWDSTDTSIEWNVERAKFVNVDGTAVKYPGCLLERY